ncbi:MAG: hypothetical protein KJ579_01820 [Verrucomicrobia bacterium]|nr:hypothetical protein [Verrucomicrobiota bacterium]
MSVRGRVGCGVGMAVWLVASMVRLGAAGELRIDGDRLAGLPTGVVAHASVRTVSEAGGAPLEFTEGGISVPTTGLVSAAAGAIDLRCRTPEDWPSAGDRTLFHAAAAAHEHVTLFFRDGTLLAVYKGGEEYFSSVRYPAAGTWKPGEWHRVQFGWQGAGEDVEFVLLVDGRLAGVSGGRRIRHWPARCDVGMRAGASPWKGQLNDIVLSGRRIAIPGLEPGERTITVHGDREEGECHAFWTVGNFNKPQEFLQPGYVQTALRSRPYVTQVNAVYLLGGRYRDQNAWFQGANPGGTIRADFTGMIAQLRAMTDGGLTPWPVLDNVPYDMSDPPQENTYGNTAPAADVRVWGAYVEAAARAMVAAFGRERVERWWFRAGTEPDLTPGHWAGTREQYFEHYDHTVAALDRVVPAAKVGPGNILNPAGGEFGAATRKQWGLDLIDHAAAGTNRATGGCGTRMDWFSFSWYGRIGEPVTGLDEAVAAIRTRMARYPKLAGLPLVVGEFAVLHDENGRRLWGGDTTEWSASFYAAVAARVYRHGIRHVYEWSQMTGGMPHPRTHVISMLKDMSGGKRLAVDVKGTSQADCGAIACRKGGDLFALVHNHRGLRTPKVRETVNLVVEDPRMVAGAAWRVSEWRVDADHGTWARAFVADCRAAGIQPSPTAGLYEGSVSLTFGQPGVDLLRKNIAKYARLAELQKTRNAEAMAVAGGRCVIPLDMPGHSVRLLRLTPAAGTP